MVVRELVFEWPAPWWPDRSVLVDVASYGDEARAARLTEVGYVDVRVFPVGDDWAVMVICEDATCTTCPTTRRVFACHTRDEAARVATIYLGTWRDVDVETYTSLRAYDGAD